MERISNSFSSLGKGIVNKISFCVYIPVIVGFGVVSDIYNSLVRRGFNRDNEDFEEDL